MNSNELRRILKIQNCHYLLNSHLNPKLESVIWDTLMVIKALVPFGINFSSVPSSSLKKDNLFVLPLDCRRFGLISRREGLS